MNMTKHTNLRLPVLPWVKKVLIKEFGPEPIRITGDTLLGKHLISIGFDLPEDGRDDILVHGSTVFCSISNRLKASIQRYNDLFQAGYYFEKMAQRMLISHISAQIRTGRSARASMFDFYEMYDLGEDDYSSEAAYQLWKVYKAGRKELAEVVD